MKNKTPTSHHKAIELMRRETNRAITHVKFLENLYNEMMETKKKEKVTK
jgi:hypothetical protein